MVYKIDFHPAAESEASEAMEWYRARSVFVAQRFVLELESKIDAVLDEPERWPLFEADSRRILLSGFPYGIIYRVGEDHISILAVMHQRRKPRYWVDRS